LTGVAFDALVGAGEAAAVHQVLPDPHGVAALGEFGLDQLVQGKAGAAGSFEL
jgi:hypothetical protein